MSRNLLVDLNNIVFTLRFAKVKTPKRNQPKEQFIKELIFKETISQIAHFANEFKCDSIVITRDSKRVWRRDIFPDYKRNRDSEEDVYHTECIEAANLCCMFFETCTNAGVIEVPRCEADDIIAVFCQESDESVENIILSSDKDFVQLIDERNSLYSPPQKTFRTTEDAGYDLFLKCIRGDTNDNIRSAFPRVRETRVKKAWEDDLEMLNLMETVRKDSQKVGDVVEFNASLIDLSAQPQDIRNDIIKAIETSHNHRFGEFRIMRFFGDHNLKEFSDMLAYKERPFCGKYVFRCDK